MLVTAKGSGMAREAAVLRAMFEARKRVFVDLLGWNVPVVDGRFEIDQFDTPDAIYLLIVDASGSHSASARLLPTSRTHILDSLYPFLCEGAVPRGPSTFEITRFCLDPGQSTLARRRARNHLVSAIVDYAIAHGITKYTGVAELRWLQQILAFGWRCRPLGLPQAIGAMQLGALEIEIDSSTPSLLAEAGIYRAGDFCGEVRHAA